MATEASAGWSIRCVLLISTANIVVNMDISVRLSCFPPHRDKTYVFIAGINDI